MAANVVVVMGTRPEAIKILPVVLAMQRSELLQPIVVSTGQHSAMVREVLALGGVRPDVDLGVVSTGSLNELVADVTREFGRWLLERFESEGHANARGMREAMSGEFAAGVLVHGDTSSAMAAALAAFHLRISVGHVEAGLRTGDVSRGIESPTDRTDRCVPPGTDDDEPAEPDP